MTTDDIHWLEYYVIPKSWNVHLINRKTEKNQLEIFQKLIHHARLFAFDTETMPSFYQSKLSRTKPSLLQVAIQNENRTEKNVLLFDLQDLFESSHIHCQQIEQLIKSIFNHSNAYKLSQSFYNDLIELKCSFDEQCFHKCKLEHFIELSDLFRQVYPDEKYQQIYSLQRMTAQTLFSQLNKKLQCANWSKRPLTQALIDYAAIDVIVMIDIYDRLISKTDYDYRQTVDLNDIILYYCICNQRFISNKTRNKHIRTCYRAQKAIESDNESVPPPPPRGRGYLPPALKHAYQTMNPLYLREQIRCSTAFDELNQFNENRPPDAQFFLEDDDNEVAQAFGLQKSNTNTKVKTNRNESNVSQRSLPKPNMKIAAYPPKTNSKILLDENDLINRLQDDFDSQPEFHCHLFGLGGRGRLSSLHLSPPSPFLTKMK